MKDSPPIAIIGGYDLIAKSFYLKSRSFNQDSIFINVNNKKITGKGIYNYEIYQLKEILNTLKKFKINNLLFLGKIIRPNLSYFKSDGEIDKYIPLLINSYKKGDGKVLLEVLNIFKQKGFNILSPGEISESFFLDKYELSTKISTEDKQDFNKSIKLLNDLSKYDNAQSIVSINGYIISIEAAEGTDSMLTRTVSIRKKLNQIKTKAGLLTKMPKKNQSMLVDLPVVGPQTLKLVKRANLNGIAINRRFTIIHKKKQFLEIADEYGLKIYSPFK